MGAHSLPGNVFPPLAAGLTLKNTGIAHPVLIDVVSGDITPLEWKQGTSDALESVPVRDSVMAIADEDYFDWPVLPEAPSDLNVSASGGSAQLRWQVHGGNTTGIAVERRVGSTGKWERIAKLASDGREYTDTGLRSGQVTCYRVRAFNKSGESAYSNIARITP